MGQHHGRSAWPADDMVQSHPRNRTKSHYQYNARYSPEKDASTTTGGVNKDDLNNCVAEQMAQLKEFLREMKGTRQNNPESQIKAHYREKYRQSHLNATRARPQESTRGVQHTPRNVATA